MPLISNPQLIQLTDKIAYLWDRLGAFSGSGAYPTFTVGSAQYLATKALSDVLLTQDFDIVDAMMEQAFGGISAVSRPVMATAAFSNLIDAVESHIGSLGVTLDASVVDLATMLTFLNLTPYSVLLHSSFADAFASVTGNPLPPSGVSQPSLHPNLNASAVNGLGVRAVGGSVTLGVTPSTTYSPVHGAVEVTTTFASGTAHPTVTVAGIDDQGNTTTTWTADLGANNPAAAVSTTITPAVSATTRVTVAVASVAGIVVGSVLTVNAGLIDAEVISVEAVVGSTITAVFDKAHGAGALLTGNTTVPLTPSLAGARIASVTGITIGVTGHSAGAVRVFGVLDHQHDPS